MTANNRIIKNPNGGGVSSPSFAEKTSSYTFDSDSLGISYVRASGLNTVITLPLASKNSGRILTVERNDSANVLAVNLSNGGYRWQGTTIPTPMQNLLLNQGDVISFQSDGATWVVLSYTGLGQDNFVINGGFDFWQRGTPIALTTTTVYTADRYMYQAASAGNTTMSKIACAVSKTNNALRMTATGATTMDAGTYSMISHKFEGIVAVNMYKKVVTFSFWVRAAISGNFTLVIRDAPASHSYLSNIVINSANTWEFKTVSLLIDTDFWLNTSPSYTAVSDNTFAFVVTIALAEGSTGWAGSANAWLSGNYYGLSTQTNFLSNIGYTFDIADFMVNIGTLPAPFVRAGKTMGGELALCQRYYERASDPAIFSAYASAHPIYTCFTVYYKVPKRSQPAPVVTDVGGTPAKYSTYNAGTLGRTDDVGQCTAPTYGNDSFTANCVSNGVTYTIYGILWEVNAEI